MFLITEFQVHSLLSHSQNPFTQDFPILDVSIIKNTSQLKHEEIILGTVSLHIFVY